MVGVAGFEPTTLCPPDKCATRLRYTPTRANPYPTGDGGASGVFAAGDSLPCSSRQRLARQEGGEMAAQHRVFKRLGHQGAVAVARLQRICSHCRGEQKWNAALV